MPVVKLSRKFYETFGDEVANELTEWFNLVDATYRTQLREFNDLNFQRFDDKLEKRIAALRAELVTEFRTGLAGQKTAMAEHKADIIKWMFVFWVGNVTATAGIIFAVASLAL